MSRSETICGNGIKCPFCGHVHCATDFEIDGDYMGRLTCDKCECNFSYCAEFSLVWYTREKPY